VPVRDVPLSLHTQAILVTLRDVKWSVAVVLLAAASAAACSSHHHVADPYAAGPVGGTVVVDKVICDPTPSTCNRYVVIDPVTGTSAATLTRTVTDIAVKRLGWKESARLPVPASQGIAFDTSSPGRGGYVNSASAELKLDTGLIDQGASAASGQTILDALRQHPDAVVIRIVDTSDGTTA
jgi:hypothetical protein